MYTKYYCTLAECISNWNESVTGHKQKKDGLSSANNCQGQLEILQSVSVQWR